MAVSPNDVVPVARRGLAKYYQGHVKEGIEDCQAAIRLDSKSPVGFSNLAWILSTCADASLRDGIKAIEYAEKACHLSDRKKPEFLQVLAASYAEAGRYADAAKSERTAQTQPQFFTPKDLEESRERLRRYEAGAPWRLK